MERLAYDRCANAATDRSDKPNHPTAGTETADRLEFLNSGLVHILDEGHVATRRYGWQANRLRGLRAKRDPVRSSAPPATAPAPRLALTEARRRWAALLQQIFEVDRLACPGGHGTMCVVAFVTQPLVIDQILTHLGTRAAGEAHAGAQCPPQHGARRVRGRSGLSPTWPATGAATTGATGGTAPETRRRAPLPRPPAPAVRASRASWRIPPTAD